jgi:hypothetical protein
MLHMSKVHFGYFVIKLRNSYLFCVWTKRRLFSEVRKYGKFENKILKSFSCKDEEVTGGLRNEELLNCFLLFILLK